MDQKLFLRSRTMRWARILSVLTVVVLLASLVSMATAPEAAPRAQSVLLKMAAKSPDEAVRVIVQKRVRATGVEELVAQLGGGVIVKDLHIINAFVTEVPAKVVPELARAAGVRWVSLDGPVVQIDEDDDEGNGQDCQKYVARSQLREVYTFAIGADRLWEEAPYLQGQGVGVAVVDSGIAKHNDLKSRVVAEAKFNSLTHRMTDKYGHGTHVAGIIGGNGAKSDGTRIGVAPQVNLVNVKISDDEGKSTTSDVVEGLQWVFEHQDEYNIRVVNLSLNSSIPESYRTSPLDAAAEILWFNGIVVVVSAGNQGDGLGNGTLHPPANDPFVITVGATDDMGTVDTGDDVLAPFSAYGTTADGFAKPDLVAPGTDIISLLADKGCELYKDHLVHRGDSFYSRMSGTSMASAVTAGAVALLLQDEPNLTPDQVKYRLMATARRFDSPERAGAGYLDIYAAVQGTTMEGANPGIVTGQLLWTGSDPTAWDSANWESVNWHSVSFSSVNWD